MQEFNPLNKPKVVRGRLVLSQTISQEGLKYKDIGPLFNEFHKKHGVPFDEITLTWDEDWRGYEDCTVTLELNGQESKEASEMRIAKEEKELEAWRELKKEYEQKQRKIASDKNLQNKKVALARKNQEMTRLQKEIHNLESQI